MDRRRLGVVLIVGAILVAILGKAVGSGLFADVVTLTVSIVGLIAGGIVVAFSYRAELPRTLSVSRSSLLASSAAAHLPRAKSASEALEDAQFERYVRSFGDALDRCEDLLSSRATFEQLEASREELVRLVASPRYGLAIERGQVDAERVERLTRRLASSL